jgi:CheY-like chemotaxis protein
MNQNDFTSLFKDLLLRLYDLTAIETHPLTPCFSLPPGDEVRRAEAVQRLIIEEIERLRPKGEVILTSPEWRPYLILRRRYVDGENPHLIAASLYIGDRQFRRDHSRALQALSLRIWERYIPHAVSDALPLTGEEQQLFEPQAETLNLNEVVRGVGALLARRLEIEHVHLDITFTPEPLPVVADRTLLRQAILALLNYALHLHSGDTLYLKLTADPLPALTVTFPLEADWQSLHKTERDSLDFVQRLAASLPARLEEHFPTNQPSGEATLVLHLLPTQRTVLVVDDQPAAQRMYQRYLSQSGLKVIGLTDPSQTLPLARQLQPAAIILDVMMPHIDGWELLQALQLEPQTRSTPILVCSAWGDADLALSLGAAVFIKKPIVQKDLLDALSRFHLLEK